MLEETTLCIPLSVLSLQMIFIGLIDEQAITLLEAANTAKTNNSAIVGNPIKQRIVLLCALLLNQQ